MENLDQTASISKSISHLNKHRVGSQRLLSFRAERLVVQNGAADAAQAGGQQRQLLQPLQTLALTTTELFHHLVGKF